MMRVAGAFVLGLCALGGCLLEDAAPNDSLPGLRVIAIVAEPAEASPGERVHYRAIVAAPDGPQAKLDADWSFCRTPRPLSENAAVSVACATTEELPIPARGLDVEAAIPLDACARFGPETSAGLRPSDPDQSGGYYQPVRVMLHDRQVAVHRHRVRCKLADAPFAVVQSFEQKYHPNRAPAIVTLRVAGAATSLQLSAGAPVELELELASDAAEAYVVYDRATARLQTRVETLEVRWFASAGALQTEESVPVDGRARIRWTPPTHPGRAWIWAVLRDDRGGVSTFNQTFEVAEDAAPATP